MWGCLSYKQEWMNDFSKIPEICEPESCSDAEDNYGRSNQKCDCTETCSRYGTCCFDSPHVLLSPVRKFGKAEECLKVRGSSFGSFMVSYCNPRWRGHQLVRTLCEGTTPSDRDPLAGIPVTSPSSNVTYKNFFCSLCNFDHRGGILWNIYLKFDDTRDVVPEQGDRENILRHLEYNRRENRWGIWKTGNDDNVTEFVSLTISAEIPPSAKSIVKVCDFRLVSGCAITWNDETVKKLCRSYIFPITVSVGEGSTSRYVKFRNPHCAICNYVTDFEEANCFEAHDVPSLSFTLLLDVNPSDGDKVGETDSCDENEVHDPFFKKCRALVCALPGYTVKNGRCTST